MNIDELIAEARATEIDREMVEAVETRLAAAEKTFEEEARLKAVDEEFLSRSYSL